PSAVRLRDEDIASSVADEHGCPDRIDRKAPRFEEGEVVVDPAPDAVCRFLVNRFANDQRELGPAKLGAVGLAEIEVLEQPRRIFVDPSHRIRVLAVELADENLLALLRPAEL